MFNIQSTTEYEAIKELQAMDNHSSTALQQFIANVTNAYNAFWFGNVSPEVKIQLLGTQALDIFTRSAQAQAFIKSQLPEYVELTIPEGYSIEWNEDGSGVISYTAPVINSLVTEVVEE